MFFGLFDCHAQVKNQRENYIYEYVEYMPEFPGGNDSLISYLSENINYPKNANLKNIQGTVLVSFIIDSDGKTTDIKVIKGIGYGCDEEAMRVVREMPRWKPGYQHGKPVNMIFNLPITFKLFD